MQHPINFKDIHILGSELVKRLTLTKMKADVATRRQFNCMKKDTSESLLPNLVIFVNLSSLHVWQQNNMLHSKQLSASLVGITNPSQEPLNMQPD